MGMVSHQVAAGHSGGLNMAHETAMARSHDRVVFPNMASGVPPQNLSGPAADPRNIQSTDSYCRQHEITVTVITFYLHINGFLLE